MLKPQEALRVSQLRVAVRIPFVITNHLSLPACGPPRLFVLQDLPLFNQDSTWLAVARAMIAYLSSVQERRMKTGRKREI
jgi:hypothetical protein